jgi:hypothetical protein
MSDYCTDTVPVLLRRATFCRAFAADAKDFRAYNSWVRWRRVPFLWHDLGFAACAHRALHGGQCTVGLIGTAW